jgi:hypothetical protein
MQQEGRLVDFEDQPHDTHAWRCGAFTADASGPEGTPGFAPILPGAEGATVTVERGFDPAAVRVTGNVRGEPPYQGVLRHAGWRSAQFRLPDTTGDRDHTILAPAEVEVL